MQEWTKDVRWWLDNKFNVHGKLVGAVRHIRDKDSARREDLVRFMRMYAGKAQTGLTAGTYYRPKSPHRNDRIQLNVIRSCVDAVASKMSSNRPEPMFLTSGADYGLQTSAKRLGKYCSGIFYRNGLYAQAIQCFRDAEITGTGAMKIYEEGGKVLVERVYPFELMVDQREAMYGQPRSIYHERTIDRKVLAEKFPEHKSVIMESREFFDDEHNLGEEFHPDQLTVIEAWHLPSAKGAKDGRHVICLPDATLADEPYTRSGFPFAFVRWSEPVMGFWGTGLAEEIYSIQLEINKILQQIQNSFQLGSNPVVFVPRGSKMNTQTISNRPFNIIETSGPPYKIETFQTVHPELFAHLDRLYERAYQIAGVSQLSAQSQKPAGIDSGRGMLIYNDIESERFKVVGKTYENFFMDIAKQGVDVSRSMYVDQEVDHEVSAVAKRRRKSFVEKIRWSEVNLEEDSYEMRVMPVSSLPNQPAGRMKTVEGWLQAGFIDKIQAMRLLELPDTEAYQSLELAAEDNILDAMETMIEDGEYIAPEPFDDLVRCVKLGQAAYNRAKLDGVPEDRLQLIRDYIEAANALLPPPPAPPMGPEGGAPPGAPPMM